MNLRQQNLSGTETFSIKHLVIVTRFWTILIYNAVVVLIFRIILNIENTLSAHTADKTL